MVTQTLLMAAVLLATGDAKPQVTVVVRVGEGVKYDRVQQIQKALEGVPGVKVELQIGGLAKTLYAVIPLEKYRRSGPGAFSPDLEIVAQASPQVVAKAVEALLSVGVSGIEIGSLPMRGGRGGFGGGTGGPMPAGTLYPQPGGVVQPGLVPGGSVQPPPVQVVPPQRIQIAGPGGPPQVPQTRVEVVGLQDGLRRLEQQLSRLTEEVKMLRDMSPGKKDKAEKTGTTKTGKQEPAPLEPFLEKIPPGKKG